jgi:predicted signal transduction protein with EAL and GGDEF domain
MQVAQRIRTLTCDTDTVARLGGDEFAIVQSAAEEPGDAAVLAQRLVERLAEPFEIDGCTLCISASVGIAIYPTDGESAEQLQRHAGLALHRAKLLGRNAFCFFEPEMDMALQARRARELDLRGALERNELHLHYQPLFDGADLHVVGWEALMRWEHPTRGNISPAEFIPAAEECGFIQQLGYWALETACREAASWETQDRIAVNLSPAQFRHRDLVERVTGIIERSGLAPERLELEVTEGVLIDDSERALAVLRAFKERGIRIALDDFGTGYSSLSYLRRFPFDKIKIDRSFVTEVGKTQEADEIVRAILALSRTLGLAVTAEGVETREQLAMLRANRCDQIQGFYLGRPACRDMPRGMRRAPSSLRVVPAEPVHLAAS